MANFSAFGSALATVASKVVTPKKFIYNIAALNNYASLYYFMAGRKMSEMLRAGADVRARVKFTASSKAGWYEVPSEAHSPQDSQDGSWAIAYWCAHMAHESWKDEELLINSGGTTEGSLAEETWTQELFSKLQSLTTALHGSLAAGLWAKPNNVTMNGTDPKQPLSIPAYLNPMANGLFIEDAATTWASIHGLRPQDTHPRYKPNVSTYADWTINSTSNLIFALSKACRLTTLIPPPKDQEYFDPEGETSIERSQGVIFASAHGVAKAENLYRASQDRWADYNDPAGNPRFKGTQFVHEAQLDTAAIHPDASGYGTVLESSTAAGLAGPRYYGVNAKYMKMYFHKARFMEFLEPFRLSLTGWQQGVNTMATMLCPDRSKHFLISPSADLYT